MDNVLTIKLEGDEPAGAPPVPSVPPTPKVDERHNPLLEDIFGVPRTLPTQDIAEAAARRAVIEAARRAREEDAMSFFAGGGASKQTEAVRDVGTGIPFAAPVPAAPAAQPSPQGATPQLANIFAGLQRLMAANTPGGVAAVANAVAGGLGGAGGGAAAGGALAAAGPAAAAVAGFVLAVNALDGAIEEGGKSLRENIETAGKVAKDFVKNDAVGGVTAAMDRGAKGIGKFADEIMYVAPVVGLPMKALSEQVKTAAAALKTYDDVLRGLTARGRELAGYDGRIAAASAMADVTKLMADIRESNRLGDRYASLIARQASMDARLQDALLPLKLKITQFVEWAIPFFESAIKTIVEGLNTASEAGGVVQDIYDYYLGDATRASKEIMKLLGVIGRNTEKEPDPVDFSTVYGPFDRLLQNLDDLNLVAPKPDPDGDAADRLLKLPILDGL